MRIALRFTTVAIAAVILAMALTTKPAHAAPKVAASATVVTAASTSKRIAAYRFALTQKGDWYEYGATGPNKWDCSGLIYVAYKRVGLPVPRTTYAMLQDSNDVFYRTNHPREGDLAFFGRGHVELYTSGGFYSGTTFGAHKSGTRVSYRGYNKYYHVTIFLHRRGAN